MAPTFAPRSIRASDVPAKVGAYAVLQVVGKLFFPPTCKFYFVYVRFFVAHKRSRICSHHHGSLKMTLDKAAYSIAEVTRLSGLGRSSLYTAIKAGDLVARKSGRRTVILADDLTTWLQSLAPVAAPHADR